MNQSLDAGELLNVRWAYDDPNPVAVESAARADADAILAVLAAKASAGVICDETQQQHVDTARAEVCGQNHGSMSVPSDAAVDKLEPGGWTNADFMAGARAPPLLQSYRTDVVSASDVAPTIAGDTDSAHATGSDASRQDDDVRSAKRARHKD